jgi:hypothetical protein
MSLAPALFLHIQKTAGTSVVRVACNVYENFISHYDHHGYKPEAFRYAAFVSGHFGYDYAQPLMKSRYSFTFLRDPAERVLSFYYHCLRSDPDEYTIYRLAQEKTIDDFLDMALDHQQVRSHIWNHQTWQLACGWDNIARTSILQYDDDQMISEARAHLAEFDYIGFTETFDRDMSVILDNLGISFSAEAPRINAGGSKPLPEDLPSSTRDRLRRITEMDQALFDYARSLRLNKRK